MSEVQAAGTHYALSGFCVGTTTPALSPLSNSHTRNSVSVSAVSLTGSQFQGVTNETFCIAI
jgi:hypothetical protein